MAARKEHIMNWLLLRPSTSSRSPEEEIPIPGIFTEYLESENANPGI